MNINNSSSRDTDHRILETIMRAIEENRAPPPLIEAREEFARLLARCETAEYQGDLWTFLAERPELQHDGLIMTVQKVLEFVRGEAHKYAAIKAQRVLTEDEKRYGNETLLPLLEGLSYLLSKKKRD